MRVEEDVDGRRFEIEWEITPPKRRWGGWKGTVLSKLLPGRGVAYGGDQMEDIERQRARTRPRLEKKLRAREREILRLDRREIRV